jgi:hypothetical protein
LDSLVDPREADEAGGLVLLAPFIYEWTSVLSFLLSTELTLAPGKLDLRLPKEAGPFIPDAPPSEWPWPIAVSAPVVAEECSWGPTS